MAERHEVLHAQLLVPGVYRYGYPPHTGVYRFVTNHRHSLLPVSAPPTETHCRGQREAIPSERTGAQQSFRLQVQKDRSLLRFLYHNGYCLCSKHILSVSLAPSYPPIVWIVGAIPFTE